MGKPTSNLLLATFFFAAAIMRKKAGALTSSTIFSKAPQTSKTRNSRSPTETLLCLRGNDEQVKDNEKLELNHLTGINPLVDDHSVFLLDMWGVMHDGFTPYEGVLNTVRRLKESGKRIIILSNSSKRIDSSIKMLNKLGFDPKDFEQIITSGELSWRMLAGDDSLYCETWPTLTKLLEGNRKKVFVFGSGNLDEEYCKSCGWELAPIYEASLIIARGTFTINDGQSIVQKNDNEEEYFRVMEDVLQQAAERKLPMFVTNPDKVRPDKDFPPMPGAIGDSYERALGGSEDARNLIKRIGKPFPEVYEVALRGLDPSESCMVGDSLETDIAGGAAAGCTTAWVVKDGIHGPAVSEALSYKDGAFATLHSYNQKRGLDGGTKVLPTCVVPHFRW